MDFRKLLLVFVGVVLVVLGAYGPASANKSAVSIQAPAEVAKGAEVVIQVVVTHSENNVLHYTDWVYILVNGKEAARWNYSAFSRPESADFTRELRLTATDSMEIKAEANCNLHGSAGPAVFKISVKE